MNTITTVRNRIAAAATASALLATSTTARRARDSAARWSTRPPLLAADPVVAPAPVWLRERTLDKAKQALPPTTVTKPSTLRTTPPKRTRVVTEPADKAPTNTAPKVKPSVPKVQPPNKSPTGGGTGGSGQIG
jgi:hypothetical protein